MNTKSANPGNYFPSKVYPIKRDQWEVGLRWLLLVCGVIILVIASSTVTSLAVRIFCQLLSLLLIPYSWYTLHNEYYVLESDHLLVRSGMFLWRRRYKDIVEVKPYPGLVFPDRSLAALFPDRYLLVRARLVWARPLRTTFVICPEDKEGFMRDLALRAPNLTFRGDRVIRIDKADPGATKQNG